MNSKDQPVDSSASGSESAGPDTPTKPDPDDVASSPENVDPEHEDDPQQAKTLRLLEGVHIALIALVFVAAAFSWAGAPDRIPVHWNLKGEVDRYGNKFEGLLLLPLIIVVLYFFLRLIPKIDPGQENYRQFKKTLAWIRLATTGVLVAIHMAVIATISGFEFNMSRVVGLFVGILFLVIGNFMGKIRPNWFVGVRTPWTLSSKLSWSKTHRQAGWVFCGMGLGILLTGFLNSKWVLIGVVAGSVAASLWLVVYSWYVWKNDPNRIPPANTLPGDSSAKP